MSSERRTKLPKVLMLALAVSVVVTSCVLANGATPKAAKKTTTGTTAAGMGRGPGEPAAPVSEIRQRGYAVNNAEVEAILEDDIKTKGGVKTVGDYRVVYTIDPPKGWYESTHGQLTWRAPTSGENLHLHIIIMDALTSQMLPMPSVTLDIVDQQGNVVQSKQMTFYWSPFGNHYGENFTIPSAGTYTLRVKAPSPTFRRHDFKRGDRFTTDVDVSFTGVQLTPKQPPASEMGTAAPAQGGTGAGLAQPGTVPASLPEKADDKK